MARPRRVRTLAALAGVVGLGALAATAYVSVARNGDAPPVLEPGTTVAESAAVKAALWVDASGGTCTRAAPPAAYAPAAACATFQDAYAAARYGDTVRIVSGDYDDQELHYLPGKSSEADERDIVFVSENGRAGVRVRSITGSGVRHVTFDSITVSSFILLECEDNGVPPVAQGHHPVDVTIRNSTLATTRSENARMLRVVGNSIGPSDAVIKVGASADTGGGDCTDEPPVDIRFEGNDIHDFREASADAHMECVFVEGTQGFVFRRNIVRACSVFSIFFKQQLSAGAFGMSNIVIENNMIGHPVASAFRPAGTTAVSFSGDERTRYVNVAVRHNSVNGTLLVRSDLGVTFVDTVFEGNLARARGGSCSAGAWRGNAYLEGGNACPDDLADGVTPGWKDVETDAEIRSATSNPTIDYHLVPGAWPIGRAVTIVPEDFDGDPRPLGQGGDVGADERE